MRALRLTAFLSFLLTAFLIALPTTPARAMLPEGGWYWNPSESGRGFNIEIQDNAIFMSAFVYRPDGSAVWYVGGGPMSSDRTWSADLYETTQGQCLGCPYHPATLVYAGPTSITFTNERSATLTLQGVSVNVVRQDWSGYGSNTRDALYGEWSTTDGDPSFPIYFGERISLYQALTGSSSAYAGGNRTGDTLDVAVGRWEPTLGRFGVLLNSSTTYYAFYVFSMNAFNRIEGVYWVYPKTGTLTGSGTYFVGHRTKSGARARGMNAPGMSKTAIAPVDHEPMDAVRASQAKAGEAGHPVLEGISMEDISRFAREQQAVIETVKP